MRAHRTRMLAAVLGTAVLVTGIAPAAVLAGKPADHDKKPSAHGPCARAVGRPVSRPGRADAGPDRGAHRGADTRAGAHT